MVVTRLYSSTYSPTLYDEVEWLEDGGGLSNPGPHKVGYIFMLCSDITRINVMVGGYNLSGPSAVSALSALPCR